MQKDFKISLVIPAYNEEKYIGYCLEYATKHHNGDFFEIIVIDNASTDRTGEIAKSYKGVRVVREEKKGLTHARQRGFLEAKGDILAYVDADTRIKKNHLEKIIKAFSKNPKLVCFSGPHEYYDIKKSHQILTKVFWRIFAYPTYLIVGYMTNGASFAIRKNILDKMDGFDTSISFYGEDTNIARRASKHGKVKFSLNFGIPTSGRRLNDHGILKTVIIYMINFISEVALHKPVTSIYKDVR
jgi:glycosyltransferase involved in cell wall biosynthesis